VDIIQPTYCVSILQLMKGMAVIAILLQLQVVISVMGTIYISNDSVS
jgi:hypothetical protein